MLHQQGDLKMMRTHGTRHSQLLFVLTLQKHGWLLVKLQLLHVQIYCSNKELALQSHDILLANAAQTGLDLIVITVQAENWLEGIKTELPDPMEINLVREWPSKLPWGIRQASTRFPFQMYNL